MRGSSILFLKYSQPQGRVSYAENKTVLTSFTARSPIDKGKVVTENPLSTYPDNVAPGPFDWVKLGDADN